MTDCIKQDLLTGLRITDKQQKIDDLVRAYKLFDHATNKTEATRRISAWLETRKICRENAEDATFLWKAIKFGILPSDTEKLTQGHCNSSCNFNSTRKE